MSAADNIHPRQFLAQSIQNRHDAPDVPSRPLGEDEWYHGTRSWPEIKASGGLEPKYGDGDYGRGIYLTKDREYAEDYAWRNGWGREESLGARVLTVKVDTSGANILDAGQDQFAEGPDVHGVQTKHGGMLVVRPEGKHLIKGVTEARGPDRWTREDIEAEHSW